MASPLIRSALPPQLSSLTPTQLRALAADLTESADRDTKPTRLSEYRPHAKQRRFHAAGATFRERLLMAATSWARAWLARQR